MLLNHHRFLIWSVQFSRWASVRAAELCSFAGDDHTAGVRRWRTASSAAQWIDWQSGKTNKSANGNESNTCLECAEQKIVKKKKKTRKICYKWNERHRTDSSKSTHTFYSTCEHFNCTYSQQSCKKKAHNLTCANIESDETQNSH